MGSRVGIFLSLEGGEGSGKTTQLRRVAEFLSARGRTVRTTREPGGTEVGGMIREILLTRVSALATRAELALYLAARAQLVDEVIRPSLANGIDVICDRFADSSTAYQGGGRGLGAERVEAMNDWATSGIRPDLTLYFDVAAETGLARRSARGGGNEKLDRIEREPIEFHERVREAFRAIAQRAPDRFKIVPVEGGEEQVWGRVQPMLEELLRTRREHE